MELTDKAAKQAAACMKDAGLIQNPKGEVTFVKAKADLLTGGLLGGDIVVRGIESTPQGNEYPTQRKDLGRSDFAKAAECVNVAAGSEMKAPQTPMPETVAYKGK